ncbi:MAG: rhamnogalacturonan acetylesterase [Salinivirgaceae bacterium]|jgi:lysophospholipase L1-like esterase|nr:rhamnogalacturonan acetylesterase [Salinivirgaceae bacterium]
MKSFSKIIVISFLLLATVSCKKTPVLYMIGDSTMANKEKMYLPERGWGQLLPQFFTNGIIVENHAKNGRSTRSFIYEGRWDSVCNKLQSGDFVLMQFGHNDGSEKKIGRHATPEEYEYNLRKFIHETKQKRAFPILATPVARRRFDENSMFYDTHGVYPDVVRKIAKETNVPLLEMHTLSIDLFTQLGEEETKKIFLHIAPNVYDSLPEGKIDDTHFSEFGAMEIDKLAVIEIKNKVPELAKYLK